MRPIRVYLLMLVLGAMLPGALLTGVLVWRAISSNRAISERRLLESARVDASALDREFDRSISILHALATKQPSVGVIQPGLAGDPEYLFPIRVPVMRQNVLKYVLSALVDVESVARLIPRQMPNSEEWTRTVLDSEGSSRCAHAARRITSATPPPSLFARRSGRSAKVCGAPPRVRVKRFT